MRVLSTILTIFTLPFVVMLTIVVLIELYADCKKQPTGMRMDYFTQNIKPYANRFIGKYGWHKYIFSAINWFFVAYLILR